MIILLKIGISILFGIILGLIAIRNKGLMWILIAWSLGILQATLFRIIN